MIQNAKVATHAVDRLFEHFGIDKSQGANWVRQNLAKAKFLTVTEDENGRPARIFARDGVVFAVAVDADFVFTVHPAGHENENVLAMKKEIEKLAIRKLKEIDRREKAVTRKNTILIAKVDVKLAELSLRLLRARKAEVVSELKSEIKQLNETKEQLSKEIAEIKQSKKHIAKGVALYV
ncbi:hypothetical protein FH832_002817 [Listeria monocytogenes]|nr:hypothetical protein [Listeria monocytogenes]